MGRTTREVEVTFSRDQNGWYAMVERLGEIIYTTGWYREKDEADDEAASWIKENGLVEIPF